LLDLPAALIAGMRPRQATKNLFVLVAMVFANRFDRAATALLAFAIFWLASSSVYLLNDVADREQDRAHPTKRNRPIASGRLPWPVGLIAGVMFGLGGVAAAFAVNLRFGSITLLYLLLQAAYTLWLKHVVLVDVFAIAAGFVMRAIAGAWAIQVPISTWLLVCTLQLALFLAFGKRRHELVTLQEDAANHRRILAQYSLPFLDQMISIVLGGLTVSYALYVINSPTAAQHPHLAYTLPSVFYFIFRYLYLIHVEQKGGAPETILIEDRPTQVNALIWIALVLGAMRS
jgi:4-hydroxybenzoate polyprenyltransferase